MIIVVLFLYLFDLRHLMASAQSVTNGRKRKARESPVVSAKRKRK